MISLDDDVTLACESCNKTHRFSIKKAREFNKAHHYKCEKCVSASKFYNELIAMYQSGEYKLYQIMEFVYYNTKQKPENTDIEIIQDLKTIFSMIKKLEKVDSPIFAGTLQMDIDEARKYFQQKYRDYMEHIQYGMVHDDGDLRMIVMISNIMGININ